MCVYTLTQSWEGGGSQNRETSTKALLLDDTVAGDKIVQDGVIKDLVVDLVENINVTEDNKYDATCE